MTDSNTHRDEQALFETALGDPDHLLLDTLRLDERRRRRRRIIFLTLWLGGIAMTITLVAVLAGWLTFAAHAPAKSPGETASSSAEQFGPTDGSPLDEAVRMERAQALAAEGWQLWQAGKMREAAKQFEQAVALDAGNVSAWNGLGWATFNGGQLERAIEVFERAVELEPAFPPALNGLGQIYLARGELKTAEKYLLKAAPQASGAWYGLGRLYLLRGDFDRSLEWLEKAGAAQPDDPLLQQMMAAAKAKNLPDDLRRQIQPTQPEPATTSGAESARGWQEFNEGQFRSAELSFRRALAMNPEDASALNGLGFILLNNGQVAAAKPNFEKCLALDPDAAGAMNGLARCLKAEGNVDEAVAMWERMYEKFPGPNAAAVGLATTYLERRDYSKALPYYKELVAAWPDNAEFKQGFEAARAGAKQ